MNILDFSDGFYLDTRFGNVIQPTSRFFSIARKNSENEYELNVHGTRLSSKSLPLFDLERKKFENALMRINYHVNLENPLLIDIHLDYDIVYVSGSSFKDGDFIKRWFEAISYASFAERPIELSVNCELKSMDIIGFKKGYLVIKDDEYVLIDKCEVANSMYFYIKEDENNVLFSDYINRFQ